MIYLALAAVVALALVAVAVLHTVGQLLRSHARERQLMLNQLLHLAGRTWQPPPQVADLSDEPDGSVELRFETAPAQFGNVWGDE